MLLKIRKLLKGKKGQGLAEYGLIVAGVITMSLAAVSIYGHKTACMWAAGTALLPCAHDDTLGPIQAGKLISTVQDGSGVNRLDTAAAVAGNNTFGGYTDFENLVIDD